MIYNPYDPIVVNGERYKFDGNVHKQGKRLPNYLQNKNKVRLIIKDPAYGGNGDELPDYVAIYVHMDDAMTEEYLKWWKKTIQPFES